VFILCRDIPELLLPVRAKDELCTLTKGGPPHSGTFTVVDSFRIPSSSLGGCGASKGKEGPFKKRSRPFVRSFFRSSPVSATAAAVQRWLRQRRTGKEPKDVRSPPR